MYSEVNNSSLNRITECNFSIAYNFMNIVNSFLHIILFHINKQVQLLLLRYQSNKYSNNKRKKNGCQRKKKCTLNWSGSAVHRWTYICGQQTLEWDDEMRRFVIIFIFVFSYFYFNLLDFLIIRIYVQVLGFIFNFWSLFSMLMIFLIK